MNRGGNFAALRDRQEPTATPTPSIPTQTTSTGKAPSREGRKQIGAYVAPQLAYAVNLLALKHDRSVQSVMIEALNDVLRKHGESPIGNDG